MYSYCEEAISKLVVVQRSEHVVSSPVAPKTSRID